MLKVSKLLVFSLVAACGTGGGPQVGDHTDGGSSGSTNKGGSSGSSGSSGSASGGSSGSKGGSSGASGTGNGGSSGSSGGSSGSSGGGQIEPSIDCSSANLGAPTLRLLTKREFESTINDIFPSIAGQWSDSLPANSVSAAGFDNDASAVVGNQTASALLDTALAVGTAVAGSGLNNLLPCAATSKDHACAQTFVEQFGQRLFRRPVADTEKARYLTLFDTALASTDFPTAIKWVTAGLIQSPYAVYRSEIGKDMGGGRALNPYEVATELAYTFTGSTPTKDLLDEAASGPIKDPLGKAKAMLQTPAGQEVMQHFFEAYLAYSSVTSVVKSNIANQQPPFAQLSADMVKETRAFVSDIVLSGGTFEELLTSPAAYPSKALATFYGTDPSDGTPFPTPATDFAKVTRPPGQGLGILSQGSFLASHANTDASSPTKRGLFVYYKLLCRDKLTPPNGVPLLSAATATKTTRERYEEAHMAQGSTCKGCHAAFDPMGFGFEAFDEIGRFRTQQNGENINTVASIPDAEGNPVIDFTDEESLVTALAAQPETAQCFTAYMATFAYGSAEACLGATNAADLGTGAINIVDTFAALASEPHFTQRNSQ
jgi:hypothetical protein